MKMTSSVIIPLSVAGGAALLSLVTGFVSGVGTAQILIRGISSAVLAAGFVFLTQWLIKTFLPELTDLSSSDVDAKESSAGGSRINIVMPDEMPSHTGAPAAELSGNRAVESGEGEAALSSENKIAENSETVHNNKLNESDPDRASVPGHLDILPDLDSLEISAGGVSGGSETEMVDNTENSVTPSAPSTAAAAPASGDYGDPEDIAKAIKTVVARDQQK